MMCARVMEDSTVDDIKRGETSLNGGDVEAASSQSGLLGQRQDLLRRYTLLRAWLTVTSLYSPPGMPRVLRILYTALWILYPLHVCAFQFYMLFAPEGDGDGETGPVPSITQLSSLLLVLYQLTAHIFFLVYLHRDGTVLQRMMLEHSERDQLARLSHRFMAVAALLWALMLSLVTLPTLVDFEFYSNKMAIYYHYSKPLAIFALCCDSLYFFLLMGALAVFLTLMAGVALSAKALASTCPSAVGAGGENVSAIIARHRQVALLVQKASSEMSPLLFCSTVVLSAHAVVTALNMIRMPVVSTFFALLVVLLIVIVMLAGPASVSYYCMLIQVHVLNMEIDMSDTAASTAYVALINYIAQRQLTFTIYSYPITARGVLQLLYLIIAAMLVFLQPLLQHYVENP